MKINLKVIPQAKKNFLKEENGILKVYLTAPAVDGKANKALIAFLAKSFKKRKNQIQITKGLKLRTKTVSIED